MSKTPRVQIASVIASKSTAGDKQLSSRVAAYLLASGRTTELDSLMRDVIKLRAESGFIETTAVSAYVLSSTAVSDIKSQIKRLYPAANQIIVNQRIDSDQIGGVRLEFPDKQLDLSVRARLNRLKQLTTEK